MQKQSVKKRPASTVAKSMQNRRPARWRQVSITVLISLWMFILGVLVGRGTSPVKFDME